VLLPPPAGGRGRPTLTVVVWFCRTVAGADAAVAEQLGVHQADLGASPETPMPLLPAVPTMPAAWVPW
jgi:hypothetical protein